MRRLRNDETAPDDEADEGSRPRKQRKQRPCFSCSGKLSPLFVVLQGRLAELRILTRG